MMRPIFAVLGALVLLLVWLGLVVYQANGDLPAAVAGLGDAARRVHLPGLAAKAYLQASVMERQRLQQLDRESPAARQLVERIISRRIAAARCLLDAGSVAAAERIALEGARADYADVQARALLLEIRLQGPDHEAARRELMLLVLKEERPEFLSLLGHAFARAGRPEDAEAFYRRALDRDGNTWGALLGMAQLAAARHDRPGLAEWLGRATVAARQPAEARAVARLRPLSPDPWSRGGSQILDFLTEHAGSLIFLAAYLLFLFTPALYGLVLRGRRASAAVTARTSSDEATAGV